MCRPRHDRKSHQMRYLLDNIWASGENAFVLLPEQRRQA